MPRHNTIGNRPPNRAGAQEVVGGARRSHGHCRRVHRLLPGQDGPRHICDIDLPAREAARTYDLGQPGCALPTASRPQQHTVLEPRHVGPLQGRRKGTKHMSMPNTFLSAWARALCLCTPMTCDHLRRRLPSDIVRSCRSCCSPSAGHWQPCLGWRPSPSMHRRSGLILTCGRACDQRLHLTLFGDALRVQQIMRCVLSTRRTCTCVGLSQKGSVSGVGMSYMYWGYA